MKKTWLFIKNIIFPTLIFGLITGVLVGGFITLFKFCASNVIAWSEKTYEFMRGNWYFIPVFAVILIALAFGISKYQKYAPNSKGGGIPTAIGILRGLITFKWYRNFINVYVLSMLSFFIGVPLGSEGPSVQIGTALGRGTVKLLARNNLAWDRYVMTGGACAGFAIATGAPVSGILFAMEEAHGRISPMIVLVSMITVVFAYVTSTIISPLLNVPVRLFPELTLSVLQLKDMWIPVVVGVVIGLFSVLFILFHKLVRKVWGVKLSKVKPWIKISFSFLATLGFGLISYSFVSTGHELIIDVTNDNISWYFLIFILLFRATIMLTANSSGITGGLFLPIMAIGAIISGLTGKVLLVANVINAEYYPLIVMLGISACIAGMIKTPLTAITFAVEALCLFGNLIPVIIVVAISYAITELFGARSINETVISERLHDLYDGKQPRVIDTFVTVQKGSFVTDHQIRDILWPANTFVLSIQHSESKPIVDRHGEKFIHEGDKLHLRFSTYDEETTKRELFALVGEQDIFETTVRKV